MVSGIENIGGESKMKTQTFLKDAKEINLKENKYYIASNRIRTKALLIEGLESGATCIKVVPKNPVNKNTQEVQEILNGLMKEYQELSGEFSDGKEFEDVRIYPDKTMEYESTEYGVLSGIAPKKRSSNSVLLVTYDGAGHSEFTEGNYSILEQFRKKLNEKFGEKYCLQQCNNWASEVFLEA